MFGRVYSSVPTVVQDRDILSQMDFRMFITALPQAVPELTYCSKNMEKSSSLTDARPGIWLGLGANMSTRNLFKFFLLFLPYTL